METSAEHQVYARAVWIVLDLATGAGLDVEAICEGLSFDPRSVRRMKKVAWDEYAMLVERAEEVAGGAENVSAIARREYYRGAPELKALAGLVVSPKTLYRFIFEVLDPILFPPVAWSFEDLGTNRIRLTARTRPGVRPCGAVMRATTAPIEVLPCVIGLPPAAVDAQVDATCSVWTVTLPEAKRLRNAGRTLSLGALSRVLNAVVLGSDEANMSATLFAQGGAREERLELASQKWQLSRRQTEVLAILADGKTNKEIGAHVGCAEATVEQHVTQILERAGCPTRTILIARFWTEL